MSDIIITVGITIFFIALGLVLPYVNAEFGGSSTINNIEGTSDKMRSDTQSGSTISIWQVVKSLALIGFWTFGGIPVWLELILLEPLRIALYFIIARNIWIGGGG